MIGRANDVEYGLCASVWSENSGVTQRVAQAIDVSSQYSGGCGFESHPRQVTGRNRFLLSICMVECSV